MANPTRESPPRVKAVEGESGPEAEERLYQGLLLLIRIAAEEGADDRQEPEGCDTKPAA